MSDLVVAGLQAQQYWEDKEKNLYHFDALLNQYDLSEVDVLVFPEMFHTGFSMNAESLAEEMNDSLGITWLKQKSITHQCVSIASLIIRESNQFFNRMVAVFPNGNLEFYDKQHLFSMAGEDKVFTSGEKSKVIEYKGWRIKLQVCFDLRFPEGARNKIDSSGYPEYDLLIYNANWPKRRIAHWDLLLPARAVENQCFVFAINRVGVDGNDIEYDGHSQLVDGWGKIIQRVETSEELVVQIIKKEDLEGLRNTLVFLKDIK